MGRMTSARTLYVFIVVIFLRDIRMCQLNNYSIDRDDLEKYGQGLRIIRNNNGLLSMIAQRQSVGALKRFTTKINGNR